MNDLDDVGGKSLPYVSPIRAVLGETKIYSRAGWIIILLGLGGFALWASFALIDRGVPVTGVVAKESNRKAIQHLSGGIVDEIFVKDGAVVKAGQILARMNSTSITAQVDASRLQYWTLRATQARLIAERDGKQAITYPPELLDSGSDATIRTAQTDIFNARHAALSSELEGLLQNAEGVRRQLAGLLDSLDSKRTQLAIIVEQLNSTRELSDEGFVPKNRLLDLQRSRAQMLGAIADDTGNIEHSRHQIKELEAHVIQRKQDYLKEVSNQLADTRRDADILASRLEAQLYEQRNADITSPVAGTVMGLTLFTRGGVVAPGSRVMDVVPTEDPLIIEAMLPVNLVDRVHPGLPVDVLFSSLNTNKTPRVAGEVVLVSPDRTVDEKTNNAFYRMNIRVTPEGRRLIAEEKLPVQAGMAVELFVKTGERSFLSYLLKPFMDRMGTALSEE